MTSSFFNETTYHMITPTSLAPTSGDPFAPEIILLISLGYFFAKHFLGDFVLQNSYQLTNKVRYGHPGGVLHAAIHGMLSLPLILLLPGIHLGWYALLILAEVIAHYHIDWGKEQLLQKTRWTTNQYQYWRLFGFDQFLHLSCYLIMAALIVALYHAV